LVPSAGMIILNKKEKVSFFLDGFAKKKMEITIPYEFILYRKEVTTEKGLLMTSL
jgi:hypothetical protein